MATAGSQHDPIHRFSKNAHSGLRLQCQFRDRHEMYSLSDPKPIGRGYRLGPQHVLVADGACVVAQTVVKFLGQRHESKFQIYNESFSAASVLKFIGQQNIKCSQSHKSKSGS